MHNLQCTICELHFQFLTFHFHHLNFIILNVIIFEGAKLVKKHELSNFLKEKHDYEQYNLMQIKKKRQYSMTKQPPCKSNVNSGQQ